MGKQQPGVRDGTGSFSRDVGVREQMGEKCPFDEDEDITLAKIDEKLKE